jgi:hypothetical protein
MPFVASGLSIRAPFEAGEYANCMLPVCSFGAGSLYPLMTSAPRDESAAATVAVIKGAAAHCLEPTLEQDAIL